MAFKCVSYLGIWDIIASDLLCVSLLGIRDQAVYGNGGIFTCGLICASLLGIWGTPDPWPARSHVRPRVLITFSLWCWQSAEGDCDGGESSAGLTLGHSQAPAASGAQRPQQLHAPAVLEGLYQGLSPGEAAVAMAIASLPAFLM